MCRSRSAITVMYIAFYRDSGFEKSGISYECMRAVLDLLSCSAHVWLHVIMYHTPSDRPYTNSEEDATDCFVIASFDFSFPICFVFSSSINPSTSSLYYSVLFFLLIKSYDISFPFQISRNPNAPFMLYILPLNNHSLNVFGMPPKGWVELISFIMFIEEIHFKNSYWIYR